MGKSFALRCFANELNPNLYKMCDIRLSSVSVMEFYRQFCTALGLPTSGGKPAMFKAIQDQLYYMFKEKRQPLILAIEEAQYLNTSILNDIKMLMNFDYDSLNCFALVLVGEPVLLSHLVKPVHEALKQRITVHYEFGGLLDDEIVRYVRHKIAIAGGASSIIDDAAMSALHGLSQSNPRTIDNIMSDALAIGAQAEKQSIDAEVILSAANNRAFKLED